MLQPPPSEPSDCAVASRCSPTKPACVVTAASHGPAVASVAASATARKDDYGRTDLVFLVVFPLLFGLFNVCYWASLYFWRFDDERLDGYNSAARVTVPHDS